MEKKLNLVQLFLATKAFLSIKYFIQYGEELNSLIGDLMCNQVQENWRENFRTLDPSIWIDWIIATNEIINPEIANVTVTQVSELQGYQIMIKFIQNFVKEMPYQELIDLLNELDIAKQSSFKQSLTWKYWQLCCNETIKDRLTLDGSIFSLETKISKIQAFEIMKLFLTDYFSKIYNFEKYELFSRIQNLNFESIHNDLIYKKWLQTYDSLIVKQNNENHETTIMQAYQIMRTFLESHQNILDFQIFEDLFSKIKIDDSQYPIDYQTTYNWFHFAQQLLLETALKAINNEINYMKN